MNASSSSLPLGLLLLAAGCSDAEPQDLFDDGNDATSVPQTSAAPAPDAGAAPAASPLGFAPEPPFMPPVATTIPDIVDDCLPGRYEGTFTGQYQSPLTLVPIPFTLAGSVTFDLRTAPAGSAHLDLEDGIMSGVVDASFFGVGSSVTFRAIMVGKLNCATRSLDFAGVQNGSYQVGATGGAFEGPLRARYEPTTTAFVDGAWEVVELGRPGFGGTGVWQARRTGP